MVRFRPLPLDIDLVSLDTRSSDRYHPVEGGPCTDILSPQYIPPISGSTQRYNKPWSGENEARAKRNIRNSTKDFNRHYIRSALYDKNDMTRLV
ncbi:hypothetical protein BHE74_00024271 [Ensete ventricosum]|nr:hypothetical protein BHE74_00024271 [Ensete ventricosum]